MTKEDFCGMQTEWDPPTVLEVMSHTSKTDEKIGEIINYSFKVLNEILASTKEAKTRYMAKSAVDQIMQITNKDGHYVQNRGS